MYYVEVEAQNVFSRIYAQSPKISTFRIYSICNTGYSLSLGSEQKKLCILVNSARESENFLCNILTG